MNINIKACRNVTETSTSNFIDVEVSVFSVLIPLRNVADSDRLSYSL